jgi:hypothetical protein
MPILANVKVGALEIFASGVIVCNANEKISIQPVPGPGNYQLDIIFQRGEPSSEAKVSITVNGTIVTVTIPIDNPQGISTALPVDVGTQQGRKLSLMLASYTLGEEQATKTRVCSYTFFLGEHRNA